MLPDPDKVAEFLREAAVEDILPRFRTLASGEIMEKRPGDIVTVADHDAERRLTRHLRDLVPGSLVVGEEAVHDDSAVLKRLDSDGPLWILDPLDGTANFAAGRETFAIIVTFLRGGRALAGWIYSPVDERLAVAVRGEGAYFAGARLAVNRESRFEQMRATVNLNYFDPAVRDRARTRCRRFKNIDSPRCAGWDYIWLATGEKNFALYNRLWAWDHAAGVVIHEEAGGHTARMDGRPYRPTERGAGILSAASPDHWQAIHDYLSGSQ